jgi:DNA-binding LacI/PurR family transcriptional regulator
LGVVLAAVQEPAYALLLEQIQAQAKRHGLRLLLALHHRRLATMHAEIAQFRSEGVQAILACPVRTRQDLEQVLAGHREVERHLVTVHAAEPLPGVDLVTCDRAAGVQMAVEHLHALGHRRLALLTAAPERLPWSRVTGFERAVAERELSPGECPVAIYSSAEGPEAVLQALLQSPRPPTALIGHSDPAVLPVLALLRRQGLRVPDDISVVGFDDTPLSHYTEVPLTTVSQRIPDMAARAVELLRRKCEAGTDEIAPARIVLQPRLIVRGSTAEWR